jgi:YggT family protein
MTPRTEVVETSTAPSRAAIEQDEVAAYDPYAERRHSSYKVIQGVWLVVGLIEALIAIRFVLKVLGANPAAGFASFIYNITYPLILPFIGLFGTPQAGGSVLELHSITALIVYALVGWLIAKVLWLMIGETRSGIASSGSSVRRNVR